MTTRAISATALLAVLIGAAGAAAQGSTAAEDYVNDPVLALPRSEAFDYYPWVRALTSEPHIATGAAAQP